MQVFSITPNSPFKEKEKGSNVPFKNVGEIFDIRKFDEIFGEKFNNLNNAGWKAKSCETIYYNSSNFFGLKEIVHPKIVQLFPTSLVEILNKQIDRVDGELKFCKVEKRTWFQNDCSLIYKTVINTNFNHQTSNTLQISCSENQNPMQYLVDTVHENLADRSNQYLLYKHDKIRIASYLGIAALCTFVAVKLFRKR